MEENKLWPGRHAGKEGVWRAAIRDFDETFHRWMCGVIDEDEAYFAYEKFRRAMSRQYLKNEHTARPEFPRYGTKNLHEETRYFSLRGEFLQESIEIIDNDEPPSADDLITFRIAMYQRAIQKSWHSKTWMGGFVDVDYSSRVASTSHLRLG